MLSVSRFFTVQDSSNALLLYTQKGIDFFEMIGQFSKEKAAIEEEYSAKLRSLAKKYAKKAEEDDEILKNVSYNSGFNLYLQQLDQIAEQHHASAESIREDVVSYVTSKTCQLRSSRKNTINDLKTINDRLEEQINEMCKSAKSYSKSFKDAESAYQKFYKADKNLEVSRLELEKARTVANSRNASCEKAKQDYTMFVTATNCEQKRYHEERLPIIFSRFKSINKECIGDMCHVLQKMVTLDECLANELEKCRNAMQNIINQMSPDLDSQIVLESAEATMERPPPFEIEDLGHPKDCDARPCDSTDGKQRLEIAVAAYNAIISPNKKLMIRNLLGMKEKEADSDKSQEQPKEPYKDKDMPLHVRLSCLRAEIRELEKQLDQAVQGREGIARLQNAYYAYPQHGNPAACTELLISYAKNIETLTTNIQNMREFYTLLEMSAENSERSFGGRDTPDTTKSMSGCSTNLSSSKTFEDDGINGEIGILQNREIGAHDSGKNILRQFLSSPKSIISSPKIRQNARNSKQATPLREKKDISYPVLRSSSDIIHTTSENGMTHPLRSPYSVKKIDKIETKIIATALFEFEKSCAETMSIQPGDEVYVQETDNGDGWTRARKKKGQEIGFVPTSYLQFQVPSTSLTPL